MALDFNGMAPLRAHASMYKTIGGVSDALFPWPNVEGQANVYGHRSVAVPGSVAGLALAVERYGTMALADVLAPAIEIARSGIVPDWYLALKHAQHLEELAAFSETARVYQECARRATIPHAGQHALSAAARTVRTTSPVMSCASASRPAKYGVISTGCS